MTAAGSLKARRSKAECWRADEMAMTGGGRWDNGGTDEGWAWDSEGTEKIMINQGSIEGAVKMSQSPSTQRGFTPSEGQ